MGWTVMQVVPFACEIALWRAFVRAFGYWGARSPNDQALNDVANGLKKIRPQSAAPITPRSAPVIERWLNSALAGSGHEPLDELSRRIVAAKDLLAWRTLTPDYVGQQMVAEYAYTMLVGPEDANELPSLYHSNEISAGITLQGPDVFYPSHWHPAVEFYGVLSGDDGEWQLGDGPFVKQPAGTLIYHESNMPHAMRTNKRPLLTVYAWTGDLYTFPVTGC